MGAKDWQHYGGEVQCIDIEVMYAMHRASARLFSATRVAKPDCVVNNKPDSVGKCVGTFGRQTPCYPVRRTEDP